MLGVRNFCMDNEKFLELAISKLCTNLDGDDDIKTSLNLMHEAAQLYDSVRKSCDDNVITDVQMNRDDTKK